MPFSHRVFCRILESPSLSEVLVWLRQQGHPAQIHAGKGGTGTDLLSCYWDDVALDGGPGGAPLQLRCLRKDATGAGQMAEEVADFVADVSELPPSAVRDLVLDHLAATRSLVVIEFPADGASSEADELASALATLFVERAQGMTQRDGVGFLDEDDDLVLALG